MSTYQQYEQTFARYIVNANGLANSLRSVNMLPNLQALIDALPYYGDPDFQSAHRGALSNLLAVYLPNSSIAAQASDYGFGYATTYSYNGSFSGYQNAFYSAISLTPAAANLANVVQSAQGNLTTAWWGNYGVAALTDAIKQKVGGAIDSGKLSNALSANNSALLPALAASYLAVYSNGFAPTANALNNLASAGQLAQANTELVNSILSEEFTANINEAIAMGGDSTNAAVWFLFNLWITLKALQNPNVDNAISSFQSAGLEVPAQIGPGQWWSGGYTSWYLPLSGSDVINAASTTINASFPETEISVFSGSPLPVTTHVNKANGYCWSLVNWGSLNWYNAPPSSCFGKNTQVLMADGSVKAIELIVIGDQIQSTSGPKKVVLVESPKRAGRSLFQLNNLNVFATAGHPFRTTGTMSATRTAIDPWALIDSVATMTESGVATLQKGIQLQAYAAGNVRAITIDHIEEITDTGDKDELLYDLIIERSVTETHSYFVGGPDTFIAVDAETADPLYEPSSTIAVVTAMEMAHASSKQFLTDPVTQLPGVLAQVQLPPSYTRTRALALAVPEGKATRPKIPELSFFMNGEQWCPHASMLEGYIVRHFSRTLRRETAMGWRTSVEQYADNDQLSIVVHDVQCVGDIALTPNSTLSIELRLRGMDPGEDIVRQLEKPLSDKPSWHVSFDQSVSFGKILRSEVGVTLVGYVHNDKKVLGQFFAHIDIDTNNSGTTEHFLFGPTGAVIGRIAIETRRQSEQSAAEEAKQKSLWTNRNASAIASALGQEIGQQIRDQLAKKVSGTRDR